MAANPGKPPQSYVQRVRHGRLKLTVSNIQNRAAAHAREQASQNPSGRSTAPSSLPGGSTSSLPPAPKGGPMASPQQVPPLASVQSYVPYGPTAAANFAQNAANIAQAAALAAASKQANYPSAPKGLAGGAGKDFQGSVNYTSPGTPDTQGFAKALLERLNAPVNSNTMALMMAWFQAEGTTAKWNPMATTLNYGGSRSMPNSSVGVQEYKDMATGVAATARTLQDPRYKTIVRLLQAGINPIKLFRQAETEFDTWRGSTAGHYGLIQILKGAR